MGFAMESTVDDRVQQAGTPHLGEDQDGFLTIGQLASKYAVSLRTLRFYEDRGLLGPQRRGVLRLYDRRQRARLRMILKGKRLGFTLSEISQILGSGPGDEPAEIEAVLPRARIETQINTLERQRDQLDDAIRELRATHQRLDNSAPEAARPAA